MRQGGRTTRSGTGRRDPAPSPFSGASWSEVRPWLAPPPRATALAGWALLPLRAFLGFTFCFAGLQKLANPNFFHAASPISIQSQLAGAARRSPIHALLGPLTHVAVPIGILIAFGELAVGIGTLLGLWARAAAVGGALISLMLFLAVSYHSSPYYTGSDIVFLFAWMPLIVVGSGGVLSADAMVAEMVRRRAGGEPAAVIPVPFATVRQMCGAFDDGRCTARRGALCEPAPCPWLAPRRAASEVTQEQELSRRTFAARGALAAAAAVGAVLVGGVAAAGGRLAGKSSNSPGTPPLGLPAGATSTTAAPPTTTTTGPTTTVDSASSTTSPTTTTTAARPTPTGTKIGPASAVPVGQAAQFTDPSSGDPSLVVQPKAGTFLAFDAVCPHAGCIVGYDTRAKIFVCPCHGSQFNGRTGAVESGPAPTGLSPISIAEGPDGQLYVT